MPQKAKLFVNEKVKTIVYRFLRLNCKSTSTRIRVMLKNFSASGVASQIARCIGYELMKISVMFCVASAWGSTNLIFFFSEEEFTRIVESVFGWRNSSKSSVSNKRIFDWVEGIIGEGTYYSNLIIFDFFIYNRNFVTFTTWGCFYRLLCRPWWAINNELQRRISSSNQAFFKLDV